MNRWSLGVPSRQSGFLRVAILLGCLSIQFAATTVHAESGTGKTQLCKEIAANKWLVDYTMAHGNMSYAQQLEAIQQVTEYSELVRKACGDNRINNEIFQAAKKGVWPKWIDDEVNDLLSQL